MARRGQGVNEDPEPTQEKSYRFIFRPKNPREWLKGMQPGMPATAGQAGEVNVVILVAEDAALAVAREMLGDEADLALEARKALDPGNVNLNTLMQEKAPEFAREFSEEQGKEYRPLPLREIPLNILDGMLEAGNNSLWENYEKRWSLTPELLEMNGVQPEDFLKETGQKDES